MVSARPRHTARRRPGRTRGQRVLIGLGISLSSVFLLAAVAVAYGAWRFLQLDRYDVDLTEASGGPENYLLVGSDSREAIDPNDPDALAFRGESGFDGKRSDTILVARIDPSSESVDLLSLPRDLFIEIAGTGRRNRINTAYASGRQTLIDTVQGALGIPINHYIEVDFRGFQGLVSAVGGVPLYFDTPMRDANSGLYVLTPGCQTLQGDQALAFARSRHLQYQSGGGWRTDPSGDLGRISRQQVFIRNAIRRAVAKGLGNPATLNSLVDVAVDNVGLDDTLGLDDILALARRFRTFDADTMRTHTLPVEAFRTSAGAAVLRLLEDRSQPTLNLFRGLDPDAVLPEFVSVEVQNGTGVAGQASDVASALERLGFRVTGTGNSDPSSGVATRTAVFHGPEGEAGADLVARYLQNGAEVLPSDDLDVGEVVIVTGTDLSAVMQVPREAATTTTEATTTTAPTATTAPATTTTEAIGITPEPPEGQTCG